jgi:hypothetical protein
MNPRLLRPTSTTHPEAQVWRNAVIANGGSVSGSTLNAVSRFCRSIDAAGIRDRFYRLNLFCGAGLNAVLVPLYRGQSRTGTQYGNTTDTNTNFVSGDYTEATGLQGASGKHLNTGLLASTIDHSDSHASVYGTSLGTAPGTFGTLVGARVGGSATNLIQLDGKRNGNAANSYFSNATAVAGVSGSPVSSAGHVMGVSRTATDLQFYSNGISTGSNTTNRSTGALAAFSIFVFALNNGGIAADVSGMLCRHYSIGLGMTAGQASSYYTALQAFQTALGRNL